MDILTYINRMNQIYGNGQQAAPVYNTQKYLQGGRVGYRTGKTVRGSTIATQKPVEFYVDIIKNMIRDNRYVPPVNINPREVGKIPNFLKAKELVKAETGESFDVLYNRNIQKRKKIKRAADPEKRQRDLISMAERKGKRRVLKADPSDPVTITDRERALNFEQRKYNKDLNLKIRQNPDLILKDKLLMDKLSTTVSKDGNIIKVKPTLDDIKNRGIVEVEHQRDIYKKGKLKDLPYNRNFILGPYNREGGFKKMAETFIEKNPDANNIKVKNIIKKAEELGVTLQPNVPKGTFPTKGIGYKQVGGPVEKFANAAAHSLQGSKLDLSPKKSVTDLQKLMQGFCGYGKSAGGRIGFNKGSCSPEVAAKNFARASEDLVQGRVTGKAGKELAKKIGTVTKAGSKGTFVKIFGLYGILPDVIFEAGMIGTDVLKGKPLNEAVADNWITGAAYKTFTGKTGEKLLNERLAKLDSSTKIMGNAMNLSSEVEDLNKELARMEADRQVSTTNLGKKEIEKIKAEIAQKTKEFNTLTKDGTLIEQGTPAYESYYNKLTELRDSDRAKSIYSKIGDATVTDLTSDRYVPREKAETVLPGNYSTFKPNLLTQNEILNYAKEQNINVTPQQADEFIIENKWKQLMEQPGMKGTQDKFFNAGGRVSFSKGGFTRRGFLKLLAALGIGTAGAKAGLLGLSKVAGKKAAVKAGADIVTGTQGMPSWFPALVNKIIKEGDDVTSKLATQERQVVHTKKIDTGSTSPDDVTVYRDLDTGDIRVEVDSASNMGEAPIQLDYKAPSVIDSGKSAGKKTNPEFSAVESEPRVTNWEGDIEMDGENIVGNVDDLFSDTTKLKNYAKGEKPTMQDIVTRKRKTDKIEKIHKNPSEQLEYVEKKEGMTMDDFIDEAARVGEFEARSGTKGINLPNQKIKKASGGLASYDNYLPGIDELD